MNFFPSFPSLPVARQTKVSICQKYLVAISAQENEGSASARPRPQARAARASRHSTVNATATTTSTVPEEFATGIANSNPISSKHPLPSTSEILRILQLSSSEDSPVDLTKARICFELLVAYGSCHTSEPKPPQDPCKAWSAFLSDQQQLSELLDHCFGRSREDPRRTYRDILVACIASWQQDLH